MTISDRENLFARQDITQGMDSFWALFEKDEKTQRVKKHITYPEFLDFHLSIHKLLAEPFVHGKITCYSSI
jgi:hypothetical protein